MTDYFVGKGKNPREKSMYAQLIYIYKIQMPHSLITKQTLRPEMENSLAVFASNRKLVSNATMNVLRPAYIPIESNRSCSLICER